MTADSISERIWTLRSEDFIRFLELRLALPLSKIDASNHRNEELGPSDAALPPAAREPASCLA